MPCTARFTKPLALACLLWLGLGLPTPVSAQSLVVRVTAETENRALTFAGTSRFNLLTRRGKIQGALSSGAACRGTAVIDGAFVRGSGQMACDNGLRARFDFTLTSRLPVRGSGTAHLSDGRRATLSIHR